ncbi:MAG TPA: hypothetical protein VLE02_02090 [Nitrosarchaeum sp.]|nr:hypothetical protein [Nitrosarchaeum sp.]
MNAFNILKDDLKNCQSKAKIKCEEYYIIKIPVPDDAKEKIDDMCKILLLKPCVNLPVLTYYDGICIFLCFSRVTTQHEYNGNIGKIASQYSQFLHSSYFEDKTKFFLCSVKIFSSIPQLYFYLCEKMYKLTLRVIQKYDPTANSVNEFATYKKNMWKKISETDKYGFFFIVKKKNGESVLKKKTYQIDGSNYETYRKLLFGV